MKIEKLTSSELLDSNSYIIETENGVIIIEATLRMDILKQKLNGRKVLAVFLTHAHYDHAYYVDDYVKEFSCPIFVHKNGSAQMYGEVNNYSEGHWLVKSPKSRFTFLEGNGSVDVDGVAVNYYETPGHSHCGMCFQIGGDLFTGDLLFKTGVGRTDLETADKKALLESLKLVENLQFETLHAGHGEDSDFESQKRNISVFVRFLER